MSGIKLSRRLQHIASFVPVSSRVADIGSDHGLLVCYLVSQGIAEMAVAGEVALVAFAATEKQVKACDLDDRISVRLGDGLAVLKEPVDVVVIAGMGGELIISILSKGRKELGQVKRLVLQPNVDEPKLRQWLNRNNWEIIDERVVKDKKHFYDIIVAEQAVSELAPLTQLEYFLGPANLKKREPVFRDKLSHELAKREKILCELKKGRLGLANWRRRREATREYRLINQALKLYNS